MGVAMGNLHSDFTKDYEEYDCASMQPDPWLFHLEKIRVAGASGVATVQAKREWGDADFCGNGC